MQGVVIVRESQESGRTFPPLRCLFSVFHPRCTVPKISSHQLPPLLPGAPLIFSIRRMIIKVRLFRLLTCERRCWPDDAFDGTIGTSFGRRSRLVATAPHSPFVDGPRHLRTGQFLKSVWYKPTILERRSCFWKCVSVLILWLQTLFRRREAKGGNIAASTLIHKHETFSKAWWSTKKTCPPTHSLSSTIPVTRYVYEPLHPKRPGNMRQAQVLSRWATHLATAPTVLVSPSDFFVCACTIRLIMWLPLASASRMFSVI